MNHSLTRMAENKVKKIELPLAVKVIMIDLVLAGDNAIVIGLAAAGLIAALFWVIGRNFLAGTQ